MSELGTLHEAHTAKDLSLSLPVYFVFGRTNVSIN